MPGALPLRPHWRPRTGSAAALALLAACLTSPARAWAQETDLEVPAAPASP
ncbi:MAG: hypothetical protein JWP97_6133, partial [Labilithrix sp.]|nr:hypothetical protein [Labilithrix sp.]